MKPSHLIFAMLAGGAIASFCSGQLVFAILLLGFLLFLAIVKLCAVALKPRGPAEDAESIGEPR